MHLGIQKIGIHVGCFPIFDVLLPVDEPGWHECEWVLDHSHDLVDLFACQLTSTLVEVDLSLLAHHVSEATAYTLDGGDCEWNFVAAIHVSVKNTKNVLEFVLREMSAISTIWRR